MDSMTDSDLWTLEQASAYLNVSRSKLSYFIRNGKLMPTQIDGRPYFDPAALRRFKATFEPRTQWTLPLAMAEAKKYKELKFFRELSGGAYLFLRQKYPEELKKILLAWRVPD